MDDTHPGALRQRQGLPPRKHLSVGIERAALENPTRHRVVRVVLEQEHLPPVTEHFPATVQRGQPFIPGDVVEHIGRHDEIEWLRGDG